MKKFASSRSLNKILAQCDSSSREYEEIQAVERKWHLHLATPRLLLLDRKSKSSLFLPAPPPPKRAPSTTLTLRSKSMTAELEELEKLDEILAAAAEPTLRPDIADADSRAATVKQRPTSRRITPAEISSLFERQGLPGSEKLPGSLRKGIPRTKSVVVQPLHPPRAQRGALRGAQRQRAESARAGSGHHPGPRPTLPTEAAAAVDQVRRGRLAGQHPPWRAPGPLRGSRDRGRAPACAHQGRLRGDGCDARGPSNEHRARPQGAGGQLTARPRTRPPRRAPCRQGPAHLPAGLSRRVTRAGSRPPRGGPRAGLSADRPALSPPRHSTGRRPGPAPSSLSAPCPLPPASSSLSSPPPTSPRRGPGAGPWGGIVLFAVARRVLSVHCLSPPFPCPAPPSARGPEGRGGAARHAGAGRG
uniref:SH3 and multiple ankyrin repeat domains 3 n=1 Tax=Monodelphis domestica TaxID=13616 RepID=A0A5F8HCQ5_MONDO